MSVVILYEIKVVKEQRANASSNSFAKTWKRSTAVTLNDKAQI